MNNNKKMNVHGLLLLASLLCTDVVAGLPIPDAGQITRELQQQNKSLQKKASPGALPLTQAPDAPETPETPETSETPAANAQSDDAAIEIRQIRVTGNKKFSSRTLETLLADLLVAKQTLASLEAGAARITSYYRKRGYFMASAYIPEQDIQHGMLQITVIEGTLDQVKLHNTSRVSDARVLEHLETVADGEPLQKSEVDRQLLLLRGTAGVDKVNASLQGGAKAGTSDLLLEMTPSAPYSGRIQLNNYGNRYTGEYQLGALLNINSPLQLGDQLTLRGVGSSGDLLFGRVAYQLPVGGDGLRIGAAYSRNQYQLGKEYALLDAHGTSQTASLFATYPFLLTQTSALLGTLAYEHKKLDDRIDTVLSETDKQVQLMSMSLSGERMDTLNGGGRNAFEATLYAGHLNMDTASGRIDAQTARSNGDFFKATYLLNRLQRITDENTLSVTLSGQWAGNNLNSSEKYSLGGAFGIRAYPIGEASGDMGSILNIELAHYFTPTLRGILFYDYGHVRINRDAFLSVNDNTRTLSGAGIGMNAALQGLQLDGYLAWPMQGGSPVSELDSSAHSPRLWLQMTGMF